MKKSLVVVALLVCLVVLMSGTASAASELEEWCGSNGIFGPTGHWDAVSSTCTVIGFTAFGTLTIGETETLVIANDGILISLDGTLNNYGTIANAGTIANGSGVITGTINNFGTIDNAGRLENGSYIFNRGFVFNQAGLIYNKGYITNYRCPGAVGVITAGPTNLVNEHTIDYIVGKECG